jgi:hypothetical protein
VTLSLAWAITDGLDCLVLRGMEPTGLAGLDVRSPEVMARLLPVVPSEVVAATQTGSSIQPMLGRYQRGDDEVRFIPRFPFRPGTSYAMVVRARPAADEQMVLRITRPPTAGRPVTEVAAVYPSVPVLARNALRFYVHFSARMSEGQAARHVHLEGEDGERVSGAFSPMDFELWDPTRRRLTVLLDPARIKQGLTPHRQAGYPLEAGIVVVLVVERAFHDAGDRPLVADYRRRYDIGPDVRSRVDPATWTIEAPRAGQRDPVVISFGRPLDRALLEDCLLVADPAGKVPGHVAVEEGEQRWRFLPDKPWTRGPKRLLVDPVLEDIAGNSLMRVFDRDLERREHDPEPGARVSVPFDVASG